MGRSQTLIFPFSASPGAGIIVMHHHTQPFKLFFVPGIVGHVYNSRYSGSRNKIMGLRPA
jgi:hypothetical protein